MADEHDKRDGAHMPSHHDTYWESVKKRGCNALASIVGRGDEPDTKTELRDVLENVLRNGSASDIAGAILAAFEWMQGENEVKYKKHQ